MKFGIHFQEAISPEWHSYYLDYDLLKQKLRRAETDGAFTERDETEFVELLDSNLEKVNAFHKAQMNRIRNEIEFCTTSISDQLVPASQDYSSTTELSSLQEKINSIADDVNRLEKFTRFNYTGFLKIVKKHDRHTNYILRPMFMVRLNQCPFWKKEEDNNALLIKLSSLFSQMRNGGGGGTMSFEQPLSASLIKEPEFGVDTRRTVIKRFFVHTDDVLELKTSVLRHLPVLVYRSNDNSSPEDIDPPISTLYLDNAEMHSYCSRVESSPRSQIIRLRWYGSAKGNRYISVERRTLEDENLGDIKDKFTIKDKYVDGFLHGSQTFLQKNVKKMEANGRSKEDIDKFEDLVQQIQKFIMEKHMEPILRTYYKRTAFQIPGDTAVRMALDTDLCFMREDSGLFPNEPVVRRPTNNWRRPDADINFPFSNLKKDIEVNRYPYATFEIKLDLAPGEEEPRWITDLQDSSLLEKAYQFSKFVHGMAIMFDNRVPLLPYWLAQIDDDRKLLPTLPSQAPSVSVKKPAILQQHQQQSQQPHISEVTSLLSSQQQASSYLSVPSTGSATPSFASEEEEFSTSHDNRNIWQRLTQFPDQLGRILSGHRGDDNQQEQQEQAFVLPPGVKIPKKVVTPIKVEPKVFFANERTYFSWMKFGTMLSTFSLALFNTGDAVGKLSGVLYTLIALSTLIYGVGLYYRRRELIRARLAGPYDEMIGPTVICFALVAAVGINAYLKFTVPAPGLLYLF
ncbi:vacuolar transporter chaperone (VTC) complex subunit [Mucor ambiguus]|uniref:Vacuolar transporter chaperone (VTC) complex subunit n=1 Tax=Mucor ambiguus TaxID=91626 RepID=A0A0C9MF01_9FUNG|nr:vacuolar transporter chaperone (VTC) complex subunit [Mucor ambiguus]